MTVNKKLAAVDTWQDCVQALHDYVYQTAQGHCLVWINPAQTDVFADNPLVQERRVIVPISHARFDVQFAPYLVALDLSTSGDSDLLEQSVQIAYEAWELPSLQAYAGQTIAGWIVSHTTPQKIARYWADQTHLHNVGQLTKLLRFHDPSVREWLWPALTELQQTKLLGPAEVLIGISRQKRMMLHSQSSAFDKTDNTKLRLSEEQWLEVDDYAVLHEAWLAQASQEPPEWRHILPQNWQVRIFKALQKATQYGITDEQDRVLFAQHAIQIGPDFHAHPSLKDVWLKTREGGFYGGAIEAVTGQSCTALQTYLNNQTT